MSLPLPANVAVSIYRGFNAANPYPAISVQPDSAGVAGHLEHHIASGRFGVGLYLHWTNVLLLPADTEIRSAYDSQLNGYVPTRADTVLIADHPTPGWCSAFRTVLVQRRGRGQSWQHQRVYLDRCLPRKGACGPKGRCCSQDLPELLFVTLASNGGCPCMDGVFGQIAYNYATRRWEGTFPLPGCGAGRYLNIAFYCPPDGDECSWLCDVSGCVTATQVPFFNTCNCSPFIVTFQIHDAAGSCCSGDGYFLITVTS